MIAAINRLEGRTSGGRFAAGNKASKGNPHQRRIQCNRGAFLKVVGPDDIQAFVLAILNKAKSGDVPAAALLLSYAIGKPLHAPDPAAQSLVDRRAEFEAANKTDPALVDSDFQSWIVEQVRAHGALPNPITGGEFDANYAAFLRERMVLEDCLSANATTVVEVRMVDDFFGSKAAATANGKGTE